VVQEGGNGRIFGGCSVLAKTDSFGREGYSDVHLFSKRDAYRSAEYVVLKTATTELALSADHYVQSNGALRLARCCLGC